MRRFGMLLGTLLVIAVNAAANLIPINGQTTGALSAKYPTGFTPAGWVFSIWSLIYLGLLALSVWSIRADERAAARLDAIRVPFYVSCAANAAWIFVWHYEQILASVLVMLVLLASLVVVYVRLRRTSAASLAERLSVDFPFSLYLGWITTATFANLGAWLFDLGRYPFGLGMDGWALVSVVLATALYVGVGARTRDAVFVAVFAWASLGIVYQTLEISQPVRIVSAAACAAVTLLVVLLVAGTRRSGVAAGAWLCALRIAGAPAETHAKDGLELQRLTLAAGAGAGQPSVAHDARAGFVFTWQERSGDRASLWFSQLDRDGRERRRGRIAEGTGWFVNWADFPSLAVLDNGDWVTHYLEKSAGSPYAYDVRIVRSTDRGKTWSRALAPHADGTPTQHGFVSLSPLGEDRVLVVWLDGRRGAGHHEDDVMTLRSAVLDRSGTRTEERELDESTCSCCQTDAVRWVGRTLVAYRDRSAEEIRDIAVTVRSADGTWSKPRVLNADGWRIEGCPVNGPALATSGDRLIAVWPTMAGGAYEVRYAVREWDRPAPMQTLASGAGTLGRVDAAAWDEGFLVSWLGASADAMAGAAVQLARIDSTGKMLGQQSISIVAASRMSGNPRLASAGDRALIAWMEPGAENSASKLAVALIRPRAAVTAASQPAKQ
jgi:hypothetical protein